jgi:ribonuclease P protein component
VEKEGELFQSESFGVSVYHRGDKDFSRFGFIVSNKISPDAFQRSRIKRVLKEAVRQNWPDIASGCDIVFLAKPLCSKKSTVELMSEAKERLKKIKILK